MQHVGTRIIETDRLILRRFTMDDAPAMFRNWANDPEVTKYLTWPPHGGISGTESVLRSWVDSYVKADYYQWAIVPKVLGEPIGCIAVVDCDAVLDIPEIGYCIGRAWWRQGYTSEALNAVIGELFAHTNCFAVSSRHDPNNPNSGAVMRKCGMRMTRIEHGDHNNQGECDAVFHMITYTEYDSLHNR